MAIESKVNARFTAKDDGITRRFSLLERAAARFGRNTEKSFKRASRGASRFSDITKGILAAGAIQKGFSLVKEGLLGIVNEASKIEDAEANFTPLLGSVDRARQLVDKLNIAAATTPFQFENIADVAKQLLPVMNSNIEDTVDTFRMLGDTAGGNIQKLDSITRGYVKALLKGKPDLESLNMIAEAGVPIFSEMSTAMGITKNQLFEMSSKGKLTTADLAKAFRRMTTEGGIFYKGMEIASGTFSGKMSTLRDNIALAAAEVGKAFMPQLKLLADELINVSGRVREWAIANQGLLSQGLADFITQMKDFIPVMISFLKIVTTMAKVIWGMFEAIGKSIAWVAFQAADIFGVAGMGTPQQLDRKSPEFPKTDWGKIQRVAPNEKEAIAKAENQAMTFNGRLDIAGAPEGSRATVSAAPKGFQLAMLGAN